MQLSATDKWAHWISLTAVIVAGFIVVSLEPELFKDALTRFGTIGFFVTAYGVMFAIVELWRAQSAATLANAEAKKVFSAFTTLVTAREIADCQHTIKMAIASLDESKPIPSIIILDIIKIYSQVFHAEVSADDSLHRKNRSTIESYSFNPNVASASVPHSTKSALLSIAGQLGQLEGSTKNFME
jgi:hypothetical protein